MVISHRATLAALYCIYFTVGSGEAPLFRVAPPIGDSMVSINCEKCEKQTTDNETKNEKQPTDDDDRRSQFRSSVEVRHFIESKHILLNFHPTPPQKCESF